MPHARPETKQSVRELGTGRLRDKSSARTPATVLSSHYQMQWFPADVGKSGSLRYRENLTRTSLRSQRPATS
jgi:hypothetical protein